MPVDVVRFEEGGRARWGVLRGSEIVVLRGEHTTTGDLVRAVRATDVGELSTETRNVQSVTLLSPVTRNQQFVCLGANYRQHMLESGVDPDAKVFNMVFTKATSCIVAANSDVVLPKRVRFLDYEIELGLVLSKDIRGPVDVTDANLHEFVAGAVIVNDYSARDVQIPEMQFYKGKSFRTFGPVGPHLTLLAPSEVAALRSLQLLLTVNGEIRQQDSTSNMVFSPAETLTELSRVQDFDAGDLLATGTPAGCALSVPSPMKQRLGALIPEKKKWEIFFQVQSKRPQYLKHGDVVEARIRSNDGRVDLGVQRNLIVAEA